MYNLHMYTKLFCIFSILVMKVVGRKKQGGVSRQWGLIEVRVIRGRYNPILSPSHREVEQQLLIPGFLLDFLETSCDQENLRFLEEVASGN